MLDEFLERQANENSLLDPDFNDEDNFVNEYNPDMDYENNLAKYYPKSVDELLKDIEQSNSPLPTKLPNLNKRKDDCFMLVKGNNLKGIWKLRTLDDVVINPLLEKCFEILE